MSFNRANQWLGEPIECPQCHLKFIPPVKSPTDKSHVPEKKREYWDAQFDVEIGTTLYIPDNWAHLANAARHRHERKHGSTWRCQDNPPAKMSTQTRIG